MFKKCPPAHLVSFLWHYSVVLPVFTFTAFPHPFLQVHLFSKCMISTTDFSLCFGGWGYMDGLAYSTVVTFVKSCPSLK